MWRTQSEAFWVNFKVWGLLPISFIFIASQIPLMNKYTLEKIMKHLKLIIDNEKKLKNTFFNKNELRM